MKTPQFILGRRGRRSTPRRAVRNVWLLRSVCSKNLVAFVVCACAGVLLAGLGRAAEPAEGAPRPAVSPAAPLDNLGFSFAPKDGGKARTSFFGLVGEGYKFVYVFDRSASMGEANGCALRAVQDEMERSLANLDTVNQFQIVYYNERPAVFNPTGTPGRLAFATEPNIRRAVRFVQSLTAAGGTNHESALKMAISLHPDVIFFLTDADEPELTADQLAALRDRAVGITINTIEFRNTPPPKNGNFLAELARQNGGQYTHVDIAKWCAAAKRAADAAPPKLPAE